MKRNGGDDGARTRDLRRDREAVAIGNSENVCPQGPPPTAIRAGLDLHSGCPTIAVSTRSTLSICSERRRGRYSRIFATDVFKMMPAVGGVAKLSKGSQVASAEDDVQSFSGDSQKWVHLGGPRTEELILCGMERVHNGVHNKR